MLLILQVKEHWARILSTF